jgi:hypothetical protein
LTEIAYQVKAWRCCYAINTGLIVVSWKDVNPGRNNVIPSALVWFRKVYPTNHDPDRDPDPAKGHLPVIRMIRQLPTLVTVNGKRRIREDFKSGSLGIR